MSIGVEVATVRMLLDSIGALLEHIDYQTERANEYERALLHLSRPNWSARPSGKDANDMAVYAGDALENWKRNHP